METHKVWEGTKNWIRGNDDCEYAVFEFVGEKMGVWEVKHDEFGNRGVTYLCYRTEEGGVLIHTHEWSKFLHEDHTAFIDVYDSLDDAAEDGFRQVILNMYILDRRTYDVENWRTRNQKS